MSTPLVSIVIPTFNRAQYLPRAIDSVVRQTFTDWEIILIDDGSTDHTREWAARKAREFGDRFVFLRQDNQGCSAARNRGIDAARGRFVAFLDSDDEFLPTKLERQLRLFELRPELGFVFSDYRFEDLDGTRYECAMRAKWPRTLTIPRESVEQGLFVFYENLFDALLEGYFIATIVGLIRRDVLGSTIRFPVLHAYAEEWLFYLRVVAACSVGFVDEPLCVHHATLGSLTRTDKRANHRRWFELLKSIHRAFPNIQRSSRKSFRAKLAHCCRQNGFDAVRTGSSARACGFFLQALHYEPTWKDVKALAGCAIDLLRPSRIEPNSLQRHSLQSGFGAKTIPGRSL